jgi:hypothetical protein
MCNRASDASGRSKNIFGRFRLINIKMNLLQVDYNKKKIFIENQLTLMLIAALYEPCVPRSRRRPYHFPRSGKVVGVAEDRIIMVDQENESESRRTLYPDEESESRRTVYPDEESESQRNVSLSSVRWSRSNQCTADCKPH